MKALTTHYRGYKMRSRIEARWAIFLDALNIEWQYELEGYTFDGIAYLPDFYLPQHNCFIEIKGQEPTEEERRKTRLLALHSGKHVHTFYGGIWIPGESGAYKSRIDRPPEIWAYNSSGIVGDETTHRVFAPVEVLVILQKLHEADIEVYLDEDGLSFESTINECEVDMYLQLLEVQQRVLSQVASSIKQHKDSLVKALTPPEHESIEICFQLDEEDSWGCWWHECTRCGEVAIMWGRLNSQHRCQDGAVSICRTDTPRLITAYTAARSARFEYGERG